MGYDFDEDRDLAQDSGGDDNKLYVGSANVKLFTVGDSVRVWDSVNTVGEEVTVTSIQSDHVVVTPNISDTFTTDNNAKFAILSKFTTRSNPTRAWVESAILRAQEKIDRYTHTSWLSDGRFYEQWFPFMPHYRRRYPLTTAIPFLPPDVYWHIRMPFAPMHRFDIDKGDHLDVYAGTSFKNWLDPSNGYTEWDMDDESRNKSFWVDYKAGDIFFVGHRPAYTLKGVYVRYRYGEIDYDTISGYDETYTTRVPLEIKEATLKLVGIELLSRERYATQLPGGEISGMVDIKRQIEDWKTDVDNILALKRRLIVGLGY